MFLESFRIFGCSQFVFKSLLRFKLYFVSYRQVVNEVGLAIKTDISHQGSHYMQYLTAQNTYLAPWII